MATIERRTTGAGSTYRVKWREGGRRGAPWKSETFPDARQAEAFKALVDLAGQTYPRGWVPGHGFADGAEPTDDHPDSPRFVDFADAAIDRRTRASVGTRAGYRRIVAVHVAAPGSPLADAVLADLDDDLAADFVVWMQTRVARGELSAKTAWNVHGLVSSVAADAVRRRLLDTNPFRGLAGGVPKARVEAMTILTPAEYRDVLAHVSEHYRPLTETLARTGVRFGEATALQVGDVNVLRRQLRVVRAWKSDGDGGYYLGEPKTAKGRRTIAIDPTLLRLLRPLLDRPRDSLLFTTRGGHPVRVNNYRDRVWIPACVAAGVDPIPRVHDLRHTHASWLLDAGTPITTVSRRLGHESITTTVDRYGHLMPEADRDAADGLDVTLATSDGDGAVVALDARLGAV